MSITSDWNPKQKRLKEIIRNDEMFEEARALFVNMHKLVHFSEISGLKSPTLMDILFDSLHKNELAIMPTQKDVTIAWSLWHITRIEDLTINILVNESDQILNDKWLGKLKTKVTDTANAMTDDEIMDFSLNIDVDALKDYRNAVGLRTQEVMKNLTYEDMKRKIKKESLNKILNDKGVLEHPDSIWLLDFWSKKDVAGILLMPITRHQIVHINECLNIKENIRKKKNFYRIK